jgi:hypothetical protein
MIEFLGLNIFFLWDVQSKDPTSYSFFFFMMTHLLDEHWACFVLFLRKMSLGKNEYVVLFMGHHKNKG